MNISLTFVWLGSKYDESTGNFVWSDETEVNGTEAGWAEGEPSLTGGFGEENCVMSWGFPEKNDLNDFTCTASLRELSVFADWLGYEAQTAVLCEFDCSAGPAGSM